MLKVFITVIIFFVSGLSLDNYYNTLQIISVALVKSKQYDAKSDYAVIIDYRKNLFSKRLYLVDLKSKKVLLKSRVSHAKKSGLLYPNKFSNTIGSKKSSTGAFITSTTYKGKAGFSMRLIGKDDKINSNAELRHIVFHSLNPKNPWSEGCFATPSKTNRYLISKISDGRLVYVLN